MALNINDFDNAMLEAQAEFSETMAEFTREFYEPLAMMALAQQMRQLPQPVQDKLQHQAPDAWQRLFGGGKQWS